MNTTDHIMKVDIINCQDTDHEANDHFINNLFEDEGNFGEADCAGL